MFCVCTQIVCADGCVMDLCNLIFVYHHPFQTSPICHPIYPLPTSPIVHDRFITHSLSFIRFKHPHFFHCVLYNSYYYYYPKQETGLPVATTEPQPRYTNKRVPMNSAPAARHSSFDLSVIRSPNSTCMLGLQDMKIHHKRKH
jgi:hypothetical protein